MKRTLLFLFFFVVVVVLSLGLSSLNNKSSQVPTTTTIKSFSFKRFPVLEYHHIRRPEARWSRTPENFRKDLEWLYQNGYYPMNLRDILTGFKGLPKGKIPVVLTFDDSPLNQFRYLADGKIDPECAIGVIKAFHEEHPKEWPLRATFFVLIETNNPGHNIFGQAKYAEKKLRQLTEWGMEVGGHCYSHDRLSEVTPKFARYTLARASQALKELSGQEIVSMATPMGLYPENESLFSGKYQKIAYDYKLVCEVAGGLQPVPGSPKFNPHHINRIQAIDSEWRKFFGR
ncbi:MAG: polysaccharide deacetylase family protein [Candidatus Margulisiibacteriota bacterium]